MYLNLQLILNKVQIEMPPDLLQEEENDMVRLTLPDLQLLVLKVFLLYQYVLHVLVLKIEAPLAVIMLLVGCWHVLMLVSSFFCATDQWRLLNTERAGNG